MRYLPHMQQTFASLALLSILTAAACGGGATRPPTTIGNSDTAAAGNAGKTVRDVDWMNRTYDSGDMGPVAVVNGEYEFAFDENGNQVAPDHEPANPDAYIERGSFSVSPPTYGDVDGDGREEAILVTHFHGGGTGRFSGIDVWTMKDGKETLLGGIPGGDRGDGGIANVTVDGKVVVVDRMMSMEDDGACCPSKVQIERWSWDGKAFIEDEAARKLEDFGE